MKDKIKTILFTIMVTAAFTFVVSGANYLLQDKIQANKLISKQIIILKLFGLASETAAISEDKIPELFKQKIAVAKGFPAGRTEGYQLISGNQNLMVCSFTGQGFWDTIKGFIALNTDKQTVAGIEFTQHGETPGLGGRISEPEFKQRLVNKPYKKIRDDGLRLKFVAEGTAKNSDEVDGITGATGTTVALEKIVNNAISEIIKTIEGRAKP